MKKMTLASALAVASLGFGAQSYANEGMWQPHQLPQLKKELKRTGLKIPAKKISNLTSFPMNAIISLGGCTASFVSPEGLAVTNHHCAYGSIQYNSTAEKNLLADGFLAKTKDAELQAAPGSRIYITESLDNVTDQILGGLSAELNGKERYQAIEDKEKAMVAECEQDDGYRCEIYSFHGGLEYYLIKQLAVRDVRLVYAPPASIGKYGGDTDNWMWPRHTGDWAFYRAYVGKDGKPADFSKDNVPYKPKSHLKVSAKGVKDGDFIMAAGYPGRTNRYRTSAEVLNNFTWAYPTAKGYREEYIDTIKSVAPDGSDARIKYESTIAGLANYAKNYGSMIKSYNKGDMLQRKQALEANLQKWIDSDASRKDKYGAAIADLDRLIKEGQEGKEHDLLFAYIKRTNMIPTAQRLLRLAHEKQKADAKREPGYQERDMTRFTQRMERIDRRYDAKVDAAVILHFLEKYAALPADQRIPQVNKAFGLSDGFNAESVAAILQEMHSKTGLGDKKTRLEWMNKTVADFEKSDDPFIKLAVSLYDYEMAEEAKEKARIGELQQARPAYMAAIIAYNESLNKPIYADANSSLRVTYGKVKGYSPQDGLIAKPFTTLEGLAAKYIKGDAEFDSPQKQLDAIANKDYGRYGQKWLGSVPVNFLGTLDITGGNSGSPTLNGKAELVGLLFDGVYESIIGDWDYDQKLNRSISVDSRYMLWVMEKVDGATNLIEEMDVVR
ncbi:S46 family peptidase [uncultured Pseudoteredinibacter sp.]|uniref:S46 family peptidase n=1 Tax=uncultured Pseudoteredinibacter sp. TaxID=1641701 RepID=UPI0026291567|nr:S46 family peptidase [uncultured Pseudoteredinibacter sp.]